MKLSKKLSSVLRHHLEETYQYLEDKAEVEEAKTSGFVDCSAILRLPNFQNHNIKEIKDVCTLNDKQRFTIRQHPTKLNKLQIRANQGHTIETVNPDLKRFSNPSEIKHDVIHGTYRKFWPQII